MDLAFTHPRKRSASTPELEEYDRGSPLDPFGEPLKRTKTDNELDAVDIIPIAEAWPVDIASILSSPTLMKPVETGLQAHNNFGNYREGSSMFVLCVQGDYQLHYDLLCSILPDLYSISPSLQALVLCRNPSSHSPSASASFSLPLIQAVGLSYNHFVRLGLLHPLGGGQCPLDALVLVDSRGRRRLLLPFGWGAGRHVADIGGGKTVQDRLMDLLTKAVGELQKET